MSARDFACEIRHLDQVRHDVVTVEAHQRVGVEDDRRDRGDEDDVEEEILQPARLDDRPEEGRERGEDQFDVDARRGDEHAVHPVRHHPGVADIHEEVRREDEAHDADLVHLAAEMFAGQTMAEFVDRLDDERRHPHQQRHSAKEKRFASAWSRRGCALRRKTIDGQRDDHDGDPERGLRPDPPERLGHSREEPVRIEEREAEEEDLVREIVEAAFFALRSRAAS